MDGEYEKDLESGTERRRSRSGVPDSKAPGDGPLHDQGITEGEGSGWVNDDLGDAERTAQGVEESAGTVKDGSSGSPPSIPPLPSNRRGRRLVRRYDASGEPLTAQKKLLLLDTWKRSGLPARDFAALTGLSRQTLYVWQRRFKLEGPGGLMDKPRGAPGSRVPDLTRRTILMLKDQNPDWGCQRISDMLQRGPALAASPSAVGRVLKDAGYVLIEGPTRPHPGAPREFERAKPNQLWQTDLFTFVLKRQNRRVYLVAFLDDHSRFVVSYGLHATQSAALVIEVLRSAIANYRSPEEILTDNGAQYVAWRGKSAFSRELEKRGIRQIVARPRHPQTLGKIERFWGSLWRECVERAVFLDLADAQRRIGLYIDHYNFQRPHQGIGGLVPADRFFGAAEDVLRTLKARVASSALELARNGLPRTPFYLTGNAGGKTFSVYAEGERVILQREEGTRQEIELAGPEPAGTCAHSEAEGELPAPLCPTVSPSEGIPEEEHEEVPPPGVFPLDRALEQLGEPEAEGDA